MCIRKVLAFNIGVTNMRLALVNEKFQVEKRKALSTFTGDPEALRLYKEWFMILDKFIKPMVDSYVPDIICMIGVLMKAKDVFFKQLQEANPDVNLVECHFCENVGIMGASVYALQCANII